MTKEYEVMGQNPVPGDEKYRYIVYETGEKLWDKPEHMTQLKGNILVSKTHPRIDFRGKLDYLSGRVLEIQHMAHKKGFDQMAQHLGDILGKCRQLMTSEALETPLEDTTVIGLTEKELRAQSHNPKKYFGVDHPLPNETMSSLTLALNTLRTEVRQVELAAVHAHEQQKEEYQSDILRDMNRLSSAVYILYCMQVAEEE